MNDTKSIITSFLAIIKNDIELAQKNSNPAMALYTNGTRNTLFKLEALCKLMAAIYNNEKMDKWKDRFKLLEDNLGALDYHLATLENIKKKKIKINKLQLEIVQKEIEKSGESINEIIASKKWIKSNFAKFEKLIASKNSAINENFTEKLKQYLKTEIEEINKFTESVNHNFTIMEDHVHEYRRKIRWLSIYVQCFPGMFYYKKAKLMPTWAKKYCTTAIVNSPYNKLAKKNTAIANMQLNYYPFMALSYTIQEIGAIKDVGLHNETLQHLTKQKLDNAPQLTKANKLLTQMQKDTVLEHLFI
jgi:flagellar biosynthesis chaperone FliJ